LANEKETSKKQKAGVNRLCFESNAYVCIKHLAVQQKPGLVYAIQTNALKAHATSITWRNLK
jgi:hypothetical protein